MQGCQIAVKSRTNKKALNKQHEYIPVQVQYTSKGIQQCAEQSHTHRLEPALKINLLMKLNMACRLSAARFDCAGMRAKPIERSEQRFLKDIRQIKYSLQPVHEIILAPHHGASQKDQPGTFAGRHLSWILFEAQPNRIPNARKLAL